MSSFWHPFADMHTVATAPFVVDRGDGVYVYDEAGRRYFDASASLWYANIGHGRGEVADAVVAQMRELEAYHSFVDFTTRPTLDLAARVAGLAPDPASKVFLTSGGSDAVDTAAKLTRRYFAATGQPERTVFVSREFGYHGMHAYGTSLGMEGNREGYGGDLVGGIVTVPWDDAEAVEKAIDHVGPERVAGVFVEAVIGAGGVRPPPPGYLVAVRDAVRRAGAFYVADEVITGFGRIGDWFAAGRFGLEPDLITFAKGVTSGYLPLGGVIAAPHVAAPFFDHGDAVFRHGYTYSGHTAACVAGLAVIDVLEREELPQRALALEGKLVEALRPLEDLPVVTGIRGGVGLLAAIQLDPDDATLAGRAATACRDAGVLTRAVAGGALQVSPPLVITEDELVEMAGLFRAGLAGL